MSLSEYSKEYRSKTIRELSKFNIKVTNAPELYDLDKKIFIFIKNLEIVDLLDREETKFNNLLQKILNKQKLWLLELEVYEVKFVKNY